MGKMKKMMIISVIVLLLILVIAAAILTAPVGLYFSIVEDGCDSKYLSFPPVSKNFIRGSEFKLQEIKKIFQKRSIHSSPMKMTFYYIVGTGMNGLSEKELMRFLPLKFIISTLLE